MSYVDSCVDLCRRRGAKESYPRPYATPPSYPRFVSKNSEIQVVTGKSEKRQLKPRHAVDLGEETRMCTLASIVRSFPPLFATIARRGLKYLVISDGSGEWVRYVQFINKDCFGILCPDRGTGNDVDYTKLMLRSDFLLPFYGADASGDMNKHHEELVHLVHRCSSNTTGVVMSDCSRSDPFIISSISSKVLKDGGSLVLRVNSVDDSLLYTLSKLFDKVTLFRPLLQDVYVVAIGFKRNGEASSLLSRGNSFVPVDSDFLAWVDEATNGVNDVSEVSLDYITTRRVLGI